MTTSLTTLNHVPEGLLACPPTDLARRLGGPTLLHLPGRRQPPVLISVLLHGNETSGWTGLCRYLARTQDLPRSLLIFVGNVEAAAAGVRTLPDQQDFNRIWRGAGGPEGALAQQVLASLDALAPGGLFAAVDLHNNTGHNPHYAVVTDPGTASLGLAWLFGDKAVHVQEPDTVLTRSLARFGPAVALELGPIGDARCADRADDYLARLLELETLPAADPSALTLFRTVARVHVAPDIAFAFADTATPAEPDAPERPSADLPLLLTGGVEAVNFHELPAGMVFGATQLPLSRSLRVLDNHHRDVTGQYFAVRDGELVLTRRATPAMYTTDPAVVRQDCLCYLMEPVPVTSFG